MKQILQSLKTGNTEVAEVPCPQVGGGALLIRTSRTLVSAGTERMLVEFGKAGWLEKARQQPDKVRMVLDKVKTDGLIPTAEAVFNKLDQPLAPGYCNVGTVMEVGARVVGFGVGDRVVSNGKHAEVVSVPINLCAKVPDAVSDEAASFTVLGAIALQGIRLVAPTLGETVVVTGLGLIGLMTVQLLRAHGCRVLGLDYDPGRLAMARQFGAEVVDLASGQDPVALAAAFSRQRGVDAVIITASTKSNEPVHQAALMCRKRGRIVLVGVTGLELSRADFYEKELSFQVSCSYGPGRYDHDYEERGQDYPVAFVRWTQQRNFEAVLDMMADGRLDVRPLVSHRFAIDQAEQAYALMCSAEPSMGIILTCPGAAERADAALRGEHVTLPRDPAAPVHTGATLGFIGAGNYATAALIPAFKATTCRLKVVASASGVSGVHAGRKFKFENSSTDVPGIFDDREIDAVVITTRHDSHARLICSALAKGKHVFVEKPLCLTLDELREIEQTKPANAMVMVGFNRRFAPQVQKMRQLLGGVAGPKAFVMTVNAGMIPAQHWTQDRSVGGGRIIGEACHFVDLLRYLADNNIVHSALEAMTAASGDTVSITLRFADGSIGTIHYFANGNKAFPKERLEVFASGKILQLDNFRKLSGFGWGNFKSMNLWRQDKGQKACAGAFVEAVRGARGAPIPFEQVTEVARVCIELAGMIP